MESGIGLFKEPASVREKALHPYAFDPANCDKPLSEVTDKGIHLAPQKSSLSDMWGSPFLMAPHQRTGRAPHQRVAGLRCELSAACMCGCAWSIASLLACRGMRVEKTCLCLHQLQPVQTYSYTSLTHIV